MYVAEPLSLTSSYFSIVQEVELKRDAHTETFLRMITKLRQEEILSFASPDTLTLNGMNQRSSDLEATWRK